MVVRQEKGPNQKRRKDRQPKERNRRKTNGTEGEDGQKGQVQIEYQRRKVVIIFEADIKTCFLIILV